MDALLLEKVQCVYTISDMHALLIEKVQCVWNIWSCVPSSC